MYCLYFGIFTVDATLIWNKNTFARESYLEVSGIERRKERGLEIFIIEAIAAIHGTTLC